MSEIQSIQRRQGNTVVIGNDPSMPTYCPYWYCDETAYIVKWVIIGVLFVLFLAFILGGYYHAKRRMAKGLPPLRYHRWLISRQARERFFPDRRPQQNSRTFYRPNHVEDGHSYPMNNYQYTAPPPAYHEAEAAPVYTPPTKVNPDQSYTAPSGPPPAGYNAAAESSHSNVFGLSRPPRAASPGNNK